MSTEAQGNDTHTREAWQPQDDAIQLCALFPTQSGAALNPDGSGLLL